MAIYYIDPQAGTNGTGTFASPYNVMPTLVAGNSYLFKEGTIWSGRTTTLVPNVANLTLGVYDAITGERVTDGTKLVTFDWRNSIPGNASAISLGANCGTGFDCQGLIIKSGWFVNVGGITYQSYSAHTSDATTEPGVGASWETKWVAHDTYLLDAPAWSTGVAYGSSYYGLRLNIAATNPIVRHIKTIGGGTGFSATGGTIVNPTIEHVDCRMTCQSSWQGILINGTPGGEITSGTIDDLYTDDTAGYGTYLSRITGATVIGSIVARRAKTSGIITRYVHDIAPIATIDAQYCGNFLLGTGAGFSVDSGCNDFIVLRTILLHNADNGFSTTASVDPLDPPHDIEIRNFVVMYNGSIDYISETAVDGDGLSCHVGTNIVFDTGISAYNLNSGHAHVGGASGTIRNSIIVKNGCLPDGSPAPTRYNRGGVSLVDSGGWVVENCIVDENLPYNFKLSSPVLLTAETNLIGDGTNTTNLTNSLDRAAFIAAVTSGGGTCTNIVTGEAMLNPDDDFAPLPGSAAIGTGKGVGIGLAGVDYNGNQRPAPSGNYSIGHREDYPPAKEGYGPWVHFDGTLPALTAEDGFALTRTVKTEGKPLTPGQVSKYVVGDIKSVMVTDEGDYRVYVD